MLSIILFGILALIVIVFLLSFNIKAISRHEKEEPEVPQPELLEHQQFQRSTNESDKKIPQASDEQYRQALRQFHSSQIKKPITTSINKLNDTDYRTAVRSMKNPANKGKQ